MVSERDGFKPVLQMVLLALCVPFAPFVLGALTEAILWTAVLKRVPGITFVGGFWSALGLSLVCSAVFYFCCLVYRFARAAYLRSQGKSLEERENIPLEQAREELQKARRPSFKPAAARFFVMIGTLQILSTLVPSSLAFDSPLYVVAVSFLMTVVFYLFMSVILLGLQLFVPWFEKNFL